MVRNIFILLIFLSYIEAIAKNSSLNESSTISIGNQVWMKKNLNVDHYRNGDSIPEVRDALQWANIKTGAWCYYNNDTANEAIYGKLYNWYAVNDPRAISSCWLACTK